MMTKMMRQLLRRNMWATIYTDGACSRNGQKDAARAGIGVYWPDSPENNISEPIDGRQTNQRAEIEAARRGIEQARSLGFKGVTVKTDSSYVKNAAMSWIANWERSDWSQNIVNKREFMDLSEAMKDFEVKFEQIPSSMNFADPLAREGAAKHQ